MALIMCGEAAGLKFLVVRGTVGKETQVNLKCLEMTQTYLGLIFRAIVYLHAL